MITAGDNLRIQIPSSFAMKWDTSDTTATIIGTASSKVSTTVSYEDSEQTLWIDVTSNLAAGETLIISGLFFRDFANAEATDNLELVTGGATGPVVATDDKTIAIAVPTLSSAAVQTFAVGQSAIGISTITVTEDVSNPMITAGAPNMILPWHTQPRRPCLWTSW